MLAVLDTYSSKQQLHSKNACQQFGFFATINHGVDSAIINDAWNVSTEFFDVEPGIKQSVPMTEDYPYGYENYGLWV